MVHLDYDVPFVGNTADSAHCYSAALAMVLSYFVPEVPAVVEVGERVSAKPEGKSAWPIAAPLWLQNHGLDVAVTFDFDYEALAELGIEYIRARYGDEVADWQQQHSLLPSADSVRQFLASVRFDRRTPHLALIETALTDGRLVVVTVNPKRLMQQEGYGNHSVVVKGMTDSEVLLHNPGLPPVPQQHVSHEDFVAAWSSPSNDARYLMSVGRSSQRTLDVAGMLAALDVDNLRSS